jgi:hypothetical protein
MGFQVLLKQDRLGSLTGSFHSLRSAGPKFESQIRLIRTTLFSSFWFRSEACWASARFHTGVAHRRRVTYSIRRHSGSGPDQQPSSFSVLFSEIPTSICILQNSYLLNRNSK